MTDTHSETQWLIWDGDCTFCGNAVAWFKQLDKDHAFTIIPAQACPSPPMTQELRRVAERSMIVITRDQQTIYGGRAVLYVLEHVKWRTSLMRALQKRPFVWGINAGYRIVANNRQFFSRILFPGQPGCKVDFRNPEEKQ